MRLVLDFLSTSVSPRQFLNLLITNSYYFYNRIKNDVFLDVITCSDINLRVVKTMTQTTDQGYQPLNEHLPDQLNKNFFFAEVLKRSVKLPQFEGYLAKHENI